MNELRKIKEEISKVPKAELEEFKQEITHEYNVHSIEVLIAKAELAGQKQSKPFWDRCLFLLFNLKKQRKYINW